MDKYDRLSEENERLREDIRQLYDRISKLETGLAETERRYREERDRANGWQSPAGVGLW